MNFKLIILILTGLLSALFLFFMDPIPQDPAYHDFADGREIFWIPNFWDVVSNISISLVGIVWWTRGQVDRKTSGQVDRKTSGQVDRSREEVIPILRYLRSIEGVTLSIERSRTIEGWMRTTLFLGMILTGIGSAYYHWAPDNATLVWDRIPMTIVFMSFFGILLHRYVHEGLGQWTFFIMLPVGILTVLYWYFTEQHGHGDLRPYAFIQFFPMLCIPLILWLWKVPRATISHFVIMLGLYILAKVCEHYDDAIFASISPLSGHTLKHFLSAGSLVWMGKVVR